MTIEILKTKDELQDAIDRMLDLNRDIAIVRVITMNFLDYAYISSKFGYKECLHERLGRLAGKGSQVTVVISDRCIKESKSFDEKIFRKILSSSNGNVKVRRNLHAKFILVISRKDVDNSFLITSANFTSTGLTHKGGNEIGIFFEKCYKEHEKLFKVLREYSRDIISNSTHLKANI